jgi:hypothetical protein
MNLLILNKNYDDTIYNYSSKFLNPLNKYCTITKFGPGYKHFNNNFDLNDIESFYEKKFDFIIIGHHFFNDHPNGPLFDFENNLNFENIKIPIFFFLNKEYKNLKRNLNFIKKINTKGIFSHHHISKVLGQNYYFIPFGFDQNLININFEKKIDLFFSGTLKNKTARFTNSNRISIYNEIYCNFLNFNIKKKKYKDYKMYWNDFTKINYYKKILNFIFPKSIYLTEKNYYKLLGSSKISFCTLSAFNMVGPRFFESLGSGSLVLCPKSFIYKKYSIDLTKNIIFFEDKNDFFDKLKRYKDNYNNLMEQIAINQRLFTELYSYEVRSKDIWNIIKKNM